MKESNANNTETWTVTETLNETETWARTFATLEEAKKAVVLAFDDWEEESNEPEWEEQENGSVEGRWGDLYFLLEPKKPEVWTVVEAFEGQTLPWVGVFRSLDEAKLAVAKNLEKLFEKEFKGVDWGEFSHSDNQDGTGWVEGTLEDEPNHSFHVTRVA